MSLFQSLNKKYGNNVPLLLMKSFNTHEDTLKVNSLQKLFLYILQIES
jgi:UDP-N-acetylglucosamine pyrophosphorylase